MKSELNSLQQVSGRIKDWLFILYKVRRTHCPTGFFYFWRATKLVHRCFWTTYPSSIDEFWDHKMGNIQSWREKVRILTFVRSSPGDDCLLCKSWDRKREGDPYLELKSIEFVTQVSFLRFINGFRVQFIRGTFTRLERWMNSLWK